MMNATGWNSLFLVLWIVHVLAAVACVTGIVFLLAWGVQSLSRNQLKAWGIGLVAVGLVVCTLTFAAAPLGMHTRMGAKDGTKRMMGGMHAVMKEDAMKMSMDDMAEMLEGKTDDAFDEAFIEGMIPHHQGAIDMAKMALTQAKHGEIREMATAIISAQQKEIDQMRMWMQSWGYTE